MSEIQESKGFLEIAFNTISGNRKDLSSLKKFKIKILFKKEFLKKKS